MNRVILEGYVEDEPYVRYFGYEHVRADFTLKTEEYFRTHDSESDRLISTKHRIMAWGTVAQQVEEQIKPNQKVRVEGRITYDKEMGRDGLSKTIPVIDCSELAVLEDVLIYRTTPEDLPEVLEIDWSAFGPEDEEDAVS